MERRFATATLRLIMLLPLAVLTSLRGIDFIEGETAQAALATTRTCGTGILTANAVANTGTNGMLAALSVAGCSNGAMAVGERHSTFH